MVVLKIVADNLPMRHGQASLPKLGARLHGLIFFQHTKVGGRISLANLGKFRTGTLRVAPLRYVGAVEKWHMEYWIGKDVLEPVVAEVELVVADQRVILNAICADEQVSCRKPRSVNSAVLTSPPTSGRPSNTTQRKPALAK
jgi:hypothetical protein